MRFAACFFALIVAAWPALAAENHAWYEGGTLQKATVTDWVRATPENQLATSADFIASLSGLKEIAAITDAKELADVQKRALDLRTCVNESIGGDTPSDKPVAELVVLCTILKFR